MSHVQPLGNEWIGTAFELPAGAQIEGYYTDCLDGLRYPYGLCDDGWWACDQFGWSMWLTEERRNEVIER